MFNRLLLARLMARFQGKADCVLFGHTHIPTLTRLGSTLFLNPGDARYADHAVAHVARLEIRPQGPIRAELVAVDLSAKGAGSEAAAVS